MRYSEKNETSKGVLGSNFAALGGSRVPGSRGPCPGVLVPLLHHALQEQLHFQTSRCSLVTFTEENLNGKLHFLFSVRYACNTIRVSASS